MSKKSKESFVFYRSFFESISLLPESDQLGIYKAICDMALNETKPELSDMQLAIFKLIEPQILANNRRFKNACKGGRPKKQKETKVKPKQNQSKTKPKANDNVNANENVNEKDNVNAPAHALVSADKKPENPVDDSNTPQQVESELWRTYIDASTHRKFYSKPKNGTWIYNPSTGESKAYEGE
jgi:hypothetical protein